jgi:hypothetical protein
MSWYNGGEAFYILAKRKNREVAEEFMTRLPVASNPDGPAR